MDSKSDDKKSPPPPPTEADLLKRVDKTQFGSLTPLAAAQIIALLMNSGDSSAGGPCACAPCY